MKLLASSKFLLWLTALSLLSGLAFSLYYRDFNWLARFGALVICWGILLLARPSFTDKEIGQHVIAHDSGLSLFDPEYYKRKGERVPDWVIGLQTMCYRVVQQVYMALPYASSAH
ncbi:MAG: hypothetical protein ACP5FP_01065 [Desulfuromonadaceae bacterium]